MPMKIASTKNEKPSIAKPSPKTLPNGRHEVRPEQAHLEAQDRAGDDADGEQREHHLRPAACERPVERVAGAQVAATRRTARTPGTRSRSRRAGCAPRTTAPASAAPGRGRPGSRSRTPTMLGRTWRGADEHAAPGSCRVRPGRPTGSQAGRGSSAWPPNSLRIAESSWSANVRLAARAEPLEERRAEHRHRDALVDRREDRPASLAGVGHAAGEAVQVGVRVESGAR